MVQTTKQALTGNSELINVRMEDYGDSSLSFHNYDPTTHTKLDSIIAALPSALSSDRLKVETEAAATYFEDTASNVSVGTSDTTLITVDVRGKSRLGVTVYNESGGSALNSFRVLARYHNAFTFYFPEATDAAAFTTNSADSTGNSTALVRKANQSPVTLAADAYAWIRLNVEGIESVRLDASVASGTATVDVWIIAE